MNLTNRTKWIGWLLVVTLLVAMFPAGTKASLPASVKDVLSDSRPSVVAIHDIFLTESGSTALTSGNTVTVNFPASFTGVSSLLFSDIALFKDGSNTKTVQSGACGSTDTVRFTVSSQTITFTACNSYTASAAGSIIEMKIGGTNKITSADGTANPYTITLAGTYGDSSQTLLVVLLAGVTVSATIAQSLTFTVAAVTSGACQTTGGTTVTSTATTVPYASVNTNAFYDICQALTVATNAAGGYSTTIQTTGTFTNGTNTIAKGACDSACTDTTAAAWGTATNNGYGYCMKDTTNTAANTADGTAWTGSHQCGGGSQEFKTVPNAGAAQTAQAIMKATAGTAGDTSNAGWRLSVGGAQAPGAYTDTGVYITTATF
jgi:hypothetical protein